MLRPRSRVSGQTGKHHGANRTLKHIARHGLRQRRHGGTARQTASLTSEVLRGDLLRRRRIGMQPRTNSGALDFRLPAPPAYSLGCAPALQARAANYTLGAILRANGYHHHTAYNGGNSHTSYCGSKPTKANLDSPASVCIFDMIRGIVISGEQRCSLDRPYTFTTVANDLFAISTYWSG